MQSRRSFNGGVTFLRTLRFCVGGFRLATYTLGTFWKGRVMLSWALWILSGSCGKLLDLMPKVAQ